MLANKKQLRVAKEKTDVAAALKAILTTGTAANQAEISAILQQQGFNLNQSKISRLLRKLGAIKAANEHRQIVYSLPREAAPAAPNILAELVTTIEANENLIVIHTNPGSASLVGRMLDHHLQELMILGTLAGDDTVLVIPRSVKRMEKTLQAIKFILLGINPTVKTV